jgi:hypothetical protein
MRRLHCEDPNNPNNPASGISGGVCVNHLWPVVAGGGGMNDEVLKLALEALEDLQRQYSIYPNSFWDWSKGRDAITAIKQARSAPVQEPVAWCTKSDLENMAKGFSQDVPARSMRVPQLYPKEGIMLLYTTPPAAQPSQGETK